MNLYKLVIDQYSTSVQKTKEIEAEDVRFEGVSINFYIDGELSYSTPAALTRIYEIQYE